MIKIKKCNLNFDREPLTAPFGFKGQYVKELWQIMVLIESENGFKGLGLGVQSVLWSDPQVLNKFGGVGGDNIMCLLTNYALKIMEGMTFVTPLDLLEQLLPELIRFAKQATGLENLKETFVLNSLVPIDFALWMLYNKESGHQNFDEMLPFEFKHLLSCKQEKLANIPLISYGISVENIVLLAKEGYPIFKIKIGSDPDMDKNPDKMLEWDKKRITEIHQALHDISTPHTLNGKIAYYLDANGRYDTKERILDFLDHADKIGALDNIILLEEPFEQENSIHVSDIPVRIASDESAHSNQDVIERIQLGYSAIALKPIAKTMSMTLKMIKAAVSKEVPCFCADLTVNPLMIDWNKNFAARLDVLPGMKIGVIETNGYQNYLNWDIMKSYHPCSNGSWINMNHGLFHLDNEFYEKSGGILEYSNYYMSRL